MIFSMGSLKKLIRVEKINNLFHLLIFLMLGVKENFEQKSSSLLKRSSPADNGR